VCVKLNESLSDSSAKATQVLVRDLDGSVFGASLIEAIASVNGADNLPTFVVSTDATEQDMYDKVYDGTYWASIVANEGATAVRHCRTTSLRVGS
jgi:hypothetical protein